MIVFSPHAEEQIRLRKISKESVLNAIDNSDRIKPSYRNRKIHQKIDKERILEVVTIEETSVTTIVTAYFLE